MLTQAYGKQHATTGAAGGSSSLDRVEELFGTGGKLAAALPGFEPRDEQLDLARAVAEALDQEEHLLAEAGTGTGKSLAYLLPALASGKRVVVATATKALQEQLLTKDVPVCGRRARSQRRLRASQGPGELPLPAPARRPRAARRLVGGAVSDSRGRGAVRGAARLDRDDGHGRSCRAAGRAQQNVVGRPRSGRRPVYRPALPRADGLLLGGGTRQGGRRGARDHEPRALPRGRCDPVARQRSGRRRAARPRSRRLRRGASPRGRGGCLVRRARVPRGPAPAGTGRGALGP